MKKVYSECKSLTDKHNQKNCAWGLKQFLLNMVCSPGGTKTPAMATDKAPGDLLSLPSRERELDIRHCKQTKPEIIILAEYGLRLH